ncbi:MAG: hypothetical protein HYT68_00590 [Candidatus Zambryskibacteria bacterium]|nr:hypothetical protein [Candidatus Zambryskibacteria bacterium]
MVKNILALVVLILLGFISFWVFNFINEGKVTSNRLSGTVVEVGENFFLVEGTITPTEGDSREGTVRIIVGPDTKIIKYRVIGDDSVPPGEVYEATTTIEDGVLSEIVVGIQVRVKTENNIWKKDEGRAEEITYFLIE